MQKANTLGVVIGRFQIPDPHEGHIALFDYVASRHEKMLILVGGNNVRYNTANPFPFHIIKNVLERMYPEAIVLSQMDSLVSNEHWSGTVDEKVMAASGDGKAILYGSRDSFARRYRGIFPIEEMPEIPNCSATKVREDAASYHSDHPEFRKGWLAAILSQYPVTDPTVDMAIIRPDLSQVLMGRRAKKAPFVRFFGGFVDPNDQSYEEAAMREQCEEALGIVVSKPKYIGSQRINDPRYGRSKYGIVTTFFAMEYKKGTPFAGDDMGEVEWVDLNWTLVSKVAPEHRDLVRKLLNYKADLIKKSKKTKKSKAEAKRKSKREF
ncbi:NUDIX domain-containing protein [Candidatus Nomurabacteria bacterium]|nr:NUDIX domain-containing protein [Candidatus Kaiserbacteria bacterium]MCB9814624.1 NUDIX domain-containing protein [Candidatus Nomurabacteria bacterium]